MAINFTDVNEKMLALCLKSSEDVFKNFPGAKVAELSNGRFYIYIDRGASILGVAHLDTVQEMYNYKRAINTRGEDSIFSAKLDDRLGVYTLLYHLYDDLEYDILLTTDEEMGRSTASEFVLPDGKSYNWIFEFDRSGYDVVTYDYRGTDWRKALRDVGFKLGTGSYSDICDLESLGVQGVNIGVGYYQYHSANAYFVIDEYLDNIKKFVDFYDEYRDEYFEAPAANEDPRHVHWGASHGYSRWDDVDYNEPQSETYTPKAMSYNNKTYHLSTRSCGFCGSSAFEDPKEAEYVDEMGMCYEDMAWAVKWILQYGTGVITEGTLERMAEGDFSDWQADEIDY